MELVRDGLRQIEQERGSTHCGILYRFSCRRLTEFDELLQISESNYLVLTINDEHHSIRTAPMKRFTASIVQRHLPFLPQFEIPSFRSQLHSPGRRRKGQLAKIDSFIHAV